MCKDKESTTLPESSWMDAAAAVTAIVRALNCFDWVTASKLSSQLAASMTVTPQPFPLPDAKELLSALRRKRRLPEMLQLAVAMLSGGQRDAQVYRLYAQALIDSGNLDDARKLLDNLLQSETASSRERAEAQG